MQRIAFIHDYGTFHFLSPTGSGGISFSNKTDLSISE